MVTIISWLADTGDMEPTLLFSFSGLDATDTSSFPGDCASTVLDELADMLSMSVAPLQDALRPRYNGVFSRGPRLVRAGHPLPRGVSTGFFMGQLFALSARPPAGQGVLCIAYDEEMDVAGVQFEPTPAGEW